MREALAGATEVAVETFQAMATVRSFAHEAGVAERYHQHLRHVYRLEGKEAATYAATMWAGGVRAQGTRWHGDGGRRDGAVRVLGDAMAWGRWDAVMRWHGDRGRGGTGAVGHGAAEARGQGTWGCGGTGLGDVMAWG